MGTLLSFGTSQRMDPSRVSKKSLYTVAVKVLKRTSLVGARELRCVGVLAPGSSPQRSWSSLYKPPIQKRSADLQWRVIHEAVATNRHMAHIDRCTESHCAFCQDEETLCPLWLRCPRLAPIFSLLQRWLTGLGLILDDQLFIYLFIYLVFRVFFSQILCSTE